MYRVAEKTFHGKAILIPTYGMFDKNRNEYEIQCD